MATQTVPFAEREDSERVSKEEYLRTSYRPDRDFVDGWVEKRNVGEYEHSRVQHMLDRIFGNHEREWGVITTPECRLQVSESRYRVPDVMVLRRGQKTKKIVRDVPLICIEVLSPEDTWARIRERLDEYVAMGVENVWCFEPETREVRRYTAKGFDRVTEPELTVAGTSIHLRLQEVFSALDED